MLLGPRREHRRVARLRFLAQQIRTGNRILRADDVPRLPDGEGERVMEVMFGLYANVMRDMEKLGGPLPPGAHAPKLSDNVASVTIVCTDDQAQAMESWIREREGVSLEYRDAGLG